MASLTKRPNERKEIKANQVVLKGKGKRTELPQKERLADLI